MKKNKEVKNNIFSKKNILSFFIFLFDIVLVIYCARQNKVNYAKFLYKNIFVGKTRDMLLGRNLVNCIITLFFYLYYLAIYKFMLKEKLTKKFVIGIFFVFVIINLVLFYIFTVRIY